MPHPWDDSEFPTECRLAELRRPWDIDEIWPIFEDPIQMDFCVTRSNAPWTPAAFANILVLLVDALRIDFATFDFNFSLPLDSPARRNSNFSTFFESSDDLPTPPSYINSLPIIWEQLAGRPSQTRLTTFVADSPTATTQRLKGLLTGCIPAFVDVASTFAAGQVVEDNLVRSIDVEGAGVAFAGDDTFQKLFGDPKSIDVNGSRSGNIKISFPLESLNIHELDEVDDCVEAVLPFLLEQLDDWSFLWAHTLGVDHVGHVYEVNHPQMRRKLQQSDELIRKIISNFLLRSEASGRHVMLVVAGDHGMTNLGSHGGGTLDEINAAIAVFSSRPLVPMETMPIRQVSLASSIAVLLGVPIPFSSVGAVSQFFVPNLFPNDQLSQATYEVHLAWVNAWQLRRLFVMLKIDESQDLGNIWSDIHRMVSSMNEDGILGNDGTDVMSQISRWNTLRTKIEKYLGKGLEVYESSMTDVSWLMLFVAFGISIFSTVCFLVSQVRQSSADFKFSACARYWVTHHVPEIFFILLSIFRIFSDMFCFLEAKFFRGLFASLLIWHFGRSIHTARFSLREATLWLSTLILVRVGPVVDLSEAPHLGSPNPVVVDYLPLLAILVAVPIGAQLYITRKIKNKFSVATRILSPLALGLAISHFAARGTSKTGGVGRAQLVLVISITQIILDFLSEETGAGERTCRFCMHTLSDLFLPLVILVERENVLQLLLSLSTFFLVFLLSQEKFESQFKLTDFQFSVLLYFCGLVQFYNLGHRTRLAFLPIQAGMLFVRRYVPAMSTLSVFLRTESHFFVFILFLGLAKSMRQPKLSRTTGSWFCRWSIMEGFAILIAQFELVLHRSNLMVSEVFAPRFLFHVVSLATICGLQILWLLIWSLCVPHTPKPT